MSLTDKLAELAESALDKIKSSQYDPSQLNDPIASKTDWSPLCGGGTSLRTRDFHQQSSDVVEIRRTIQILVVIILIAITGAGIFYLAWQSTSPGFIPFVAAMGFWVVAAIIFMKTKDPLFFDRENNFFGVKQKQGENKELCKVDEIHAIQLLAEKIGASRRERSGGRLLFGVRSTSGGEVTISYSYELNLILKDAQRVNVIDHGSLKHIRNDAKRLGEFLNVPVWDSIKN